MNAPAPTGAGTPSLLRRLIDLAVPMVISTGSTTVMQFFDRMFLTWHSADAARAGMPAGFLALNFMIGPMMMTGITAMLAAQHVGAGQPEKAARATAQGVWMSLAFWPLMALCIPAGNALFDRAGHPAGVLADEKIYFGILMAFSVTAPLKSALSGFFAGVGHTRVIMWANVAANGLNIALDYLLIFGGWGVPSYGIAGAAAATVIAEFLCVALYLAVYLSRPYGEFQTRREWQFNRALMAKLIRYGLPSGIHLALEFAAFSIFLVLTGRLTAEDSVASNIALNINNVAVMPILGISFAATTLVGQFQGAKDHGQAARAGWAALGLGQVLMLLAAASFLLLPDLYVGLYARGSLQELDIPLIHRRTAALLAILAAWGLFDTCNIILAGALRGAGDTRFVMWYSLGMAWLAYMPALGWLVVNDRAGLLPMWLCTAGWVGLLALGFLWRFARGRWRTIVVVDEEAL